MKFLRSWLEEYIELSDMTTQQLADRITYFSSEVEEVETISDWFGGRVVVGKINTVRPHPNADRLKVFDVDCGLLGTVSIVSAAANVAEDMHVPVALVGAKLNGYDIDPRPMRGVTSYGMCCGKSELLQEASFSSGLWVLENVENRLGESICTVYPELFASQDILDVKILPDRYGAIASYIGLAIEIAIITQQSTRLKGIAKDVWEGKNSYSEQLRAVSQDTQKTLTIHDPIGFNTYFATFRAQLSTPYVLPLAYQQRLFFLGVKGVNPLVDLSNCITMESGQSIHFFDTNKLFGENNAASLTFLELTKPVDFEGLGNLKKTQLSAELIVLNKNDECISIPGLVGGNSTKVEEECIDLMVEIPHFDSNKIMKQCFLAGYRSDGARIWSNGGHASRIPIALYLVSHYLEVSLTHLCTLTGSQQYLGNLIDLVKTTHTSIEIDWNKMTSWHTNNLDDCKVFEPLLYKLGTVEGSTLTIPYPGFSTVTSLKTLYAQLCYMATVNELPITTPSVSLVTPYHNSLYQTHYTIKCLLTDLGYTEIITRPFEASGDIEVLKPQNSELKFLRSSLSPSLLAALATNYAAGIAPLRLFELNRIYSKSPKNGVTESIQLVLGEVDAQGSDIIKSIHSIAKILGIDWKNIAVETVETENGLVHNYHWPTIPTTLTQLSNSSKKKNSLPLAKPVWLVVADITSISQTSLATHYTDLPIHPNLVRDVTIPLVGLTSQALVRKLQNLLNSEYSGLILDVVDVFFGKTASTATIRVSLPSTHNSSQLLEQVIQTITQFSPDA